jgi:hypothetical protein
MCNSYVTVPSIGIFAISALDACSAVANAKGYTSLDLEPGLGNFTIRAVAPDGTNVQGKGETVSAAATNLMEKMTNHV